MTIADDNIQSIAPEPEAAEVQPPSVIEPPPLPAQPVLIEIEPESPLTPAVPPAESPVCDAEPAPDAAAPSPPPMKMCVPETPAPGQGQFEIVPDISPEPEQALEAELAQPVEEAEEAEPILTAADSPEISAETVELLPAEAAPVSITPPPGSGGSHGWTFILICIGIGLIACCILIPQADENRALLYQCQKLKMDLEHIRKQVQVNEEFVKRINEDPAVAERLAQRQMNFIRKGTSVLDLPNQSTPEEERSPFVLTTVPPPPPLPAFEPSGGLLTSLFRESRTRLYLIGSGLMLMAMGLVLGHVTKEN